MEWGVWALFVGRTSGEPGPGQGVENVGNWGRTKSDESRNFLVICRNEEMKVSYGRKVQSLFSIEELPCIHSPWVEPRTVTHSQPCR